MDKLSYKVLKYISVREETSRKDILATFGNGAKASISFLVSNKYIDPDTPFSGVALTASPFLQAMGFSRSPVTGLPIWKKGRAKILTVG